MVQEYFTSFYGLDGLECFRPVQDFWLRMIQGLGMSGDKMSE